MPAKSEAERGFIYATKGAAFAKAHGFDNKGKLPARVGKTKKRRKAVKKKAAKKKPVRKKAAKKKVTRYRGTY